MRTYLILDYLRRQKRCTLAELMEKFHVSSATIHRDVEELSRRDAVMRVRGGLVFNENSSGVMNSSEFSERIVTNRAAKIGAAKKALRFIHEGDIIFLDSSTTVFELAMLLRNTDFEHLTIITNSIPIIQNFRKFPANFVLISLGGIYDQHLNSILGAAAFDQLEHFNFTKAFVSAFGLDDKVATTNHERQAGLLRKVLAAATHRYLLVDSSKIGRKGLYRIAPRGGFDEIFS